MFQHLPEWRLPHRILCIRLDGLGDVLMTSPALTAIKETHPNSHLALLTSSAGAAVAKLIPCIDEVLVYDAPWLKATAKRENSQPDLAWIAKLRDRQFNAAIIFTVYSQNPLPSAMMAYLADIPLRLAHCRENPYQLLTHHIPESEPQVTIRHEAQRQLDLVASIGCTTTNPQLRISFSETDRKKIEQHLQTTMLSKRSPWIVIHPGASAASRRYPAEQFVQAANLLIEQGITPIFTGITSEIPLVESIRSKLKGRSHSLAGQIDLPEMAALLSSAPLLLSNNTGPVHIAAATRTPTVVLYALTNIQHTPWRVPNRVLYHDVPCRLCYKSICPEGHQHCLSLVEPEQVVTAVLDLLQEQSHLFNEQSTFALVKA